MRTTFGTLKVGDKFKTVNRVSDQVLPQHPATKVEPGLYNGRHKYNMTQLNHHKFLRGQQKLDYCWANDDDVVEWEP